MRGLTSPSFSVSSTQITTSDVANRVLFCPFWKGHWRCILCGIKNACVLSTCSILLGILSFTYVSFFHFLLSSLSKIEQNTYLVLFQIFAVPIKCENGCHTRKLLILCQIHSRCCAAVLRKLCRSISKWEFVVHRNLFRTKIKQFLQFPFANVFRDQLQTVRRTHARLKKERPSPRWPHAPATARRRRPSLSERGYDSG